VATGTQGRTERRERDMGIIDILRKGQRNSNSRGEEGSN
jgi:hypothetical protein